MMRDVQDGHHVWQKSRLDQILKEEIWGIEKLEGQLLEDLLWGEGILKESLHSFLTRNRDENWGNHDEGELFEQCWSVSIRLIFKTLIVRDEINTKGNEHVVKEDKNWGFGPSQEQVQPWIVLGPYLFGLCWYKKF